MDFFNIVTNELLDLFDIVCEVLAINITVNE